MAFIKAFIISQVKIFILIILVEHICRSQLCWSRAGSHASHVGVPASYVVWAGACLALGEPSARGKLGKKSLDRAKCREISKLYMGHIYLEGYSLKNWSYFV